MNVERGSIEGVTDGEGKQAEEPESFGQILQQLQVIVEQLERSDLPLERSLEAFEQGVSLTRRGQSILDAAELKVEILMRNGTTRAIGEDP